MTACDEKDKNNQKQKASSRHMTSGKSRLAVGEPGEK
jgi:hypothetical protein